MKDKAINLKLALLYGGWTMDGPTVRSPNGMGEGHYGFTPIPNYTGSLDLVSGILHDDACYHNIGLMYPNKLSKVVSADFRERKQTHSNTLRATARQCCIAILMSTNDYEPDLKDLKFCVSDPLRKTTHDMTLADGGDQVKMSLGATTFHIPGYALKPIRDWFDQLLKDK